MQLIEQETIINFNKEEKEASIYTFEQKWQKHIENKLRIKPYKVYDNGAREYLIDKKRIPLPRAKRVMSEEQRKQSSERLRELRAKRK